MAVTRKGGGAYDAASPPLQATAVFFVNPGDLSVLSSASNNVTTIKTSFTRPADNTAYAANDAMADAAATVGGLTFTGAAKASGGTGTITGAIVSMSASTAVQGEIWIFDQAFTVTADNAALSVSDADILNLIGVIPFNTTDTTAANAISYVDNLNIDYTCVGSANLRYIIKVMAATAAPGTSEVCGIALKVRN